MASSSRAHDAPSIREALRVPEPEPSHHPRHARHARPPVLRRGGRRSDLVRLVVWLVAAWVVPLLTHLLRADFLLPVAILVLTAAMLRGGRTLLDRLMLALILLLGAVTVAGFLFSVWPWGLAPVPVAGCAGTVLGLIHVLGRRPLRLPRPGLTDGIVLAASLVVAGYFARWYVRGDHAAKLAQLMLGEDNSRHFAAFDAITRLGSYLYWHPGEHMQLYPQGWHLAAALLDGFARSSSGVPDIATGLDHYVGLTIITYGLFVLTVLWGVFWIAGPLLTPLRSLPVVAAVAGVLTFGEFPLNLQIGFVSEVFGLTLVAALIAVIARRPGSLREQVVLLSAPLVGIGLSYHLYLPAAVLAIAGWAWIQRRRLRDLLPLPLILVPTLAVAAFPLVVGILFAQNVEGVTWDGGIYTSSKTQIYAIGALVAAGLVTPTARRLRVWRFYTLGLVAVVSLPVLLRIYLFVVSAEATYYLEKTLAVTTVALLVGAGVVTLLMPPPQARRAPAAGSDAGRLSRRGALARVSPYAPILLLTFAIGAGIGWVGIDAPYRPVLVGDINASRHFGSGGAQSKMVPMAEQVVALAGQFPAEPGAATIVLHRDRVHSYHESMYLAMYQRTAPQPGIPLSDILEGDLEGIEEFAVARYDDGGQLRIIAVDGWGARMAARIQANVPAGAVTVVTPTD